MPKLIIGLIVGICVGAAGMFFSNRQPIEPDLLRYQAAYEIGSIPLAKFSQGNCVTERLLASNICKALSLKSYKNLGTHNDLWVTLDYMGSIDKRQKSGALSALFYEALKYTFGWSHRGNPEDVVDVVTAIDVYRLFVVAAKLCEEGQLGDCDNGLPDELRERILEFSSTAQYNCLVEPDYYCSIYAETIKEIQNYI